MDIREYIKNNILVFDGAMGTYYAGTNKNALAKCEMANIEDPQAILDIHKQYIASGAIAIKTNTFGANEISLECDFETVSEVIKKGYAIAIKAVENTNTFIFSDIGPIPLKEEMNALEHYKKIIDIFLDLGAQNFLFETFSSSDYLEELSEYIKNKNHSAFILTQFAITPEGFTRQGISGSKIFKQINECKTIDAMGFNCISGPLHLLEFIKKLNIKDKLISIMPNAGYPTIINNRTFYQSNAEYFATQMLEIAKQGVGILGGCCGTTPEYIEQTLKRINTLSLSDVTINDAVALEPSKPNVHRNKLIEKMNNGEKIIAVELDPPIDTNIDFFMSSAKKLKDSGVDAITIADCPIARARVDSSLLACKIKRELDITAIPHMTCRDRNINATKALLLGLNIEGVENVLVVTGDPIPSAERNEVKSVFSFNSAILANYIRTLNESTFSTPFNICAALNVNAKNFDAQLKHATRKVENGVTVFLTQPIFTNEAIKNLKKAREVLSAKILGGIIPIVSYRNACFMNNEISGINVSDEIIELYKDVSKEYADELAVSISTKIANDISDYVDGYYLITPFKRIDIISNIIHTIKNK
jgi:homocysteine S-methyltransferase